LEEVLGSLRYQPKRLDLLDNSQQTQRRSYVPLLAIAATLVIAALAGFFWLSYSHNQRQILTTTTTVAVAPTPAILK
jgi:type VI protein secretion system component VasF